MRILLALFIALSAFLSVSSLAADEAPPVLRGKIYALSSKYKGKKFVGLSWNIRVLDSLLGGVGVESHSIEVNGEKAKYRVRRYGNDIKLSGYHLLGKNPPRFVPVTITAVDKNGNVTCANVVIERRPGRKSYEGKLRLRNVSGCNDG